MVDLLGYLRSMQQEGGLSNTTESMTRALITDESRSGNQLGPVQLG